MTDPWGKKQWLAVTEGGEPLGVGSKRAAVEEAVEFAQDHGGDAWIEEGDAIHKESNPRGDGGIEAYWQTGLQSICLAKYGTKGSPHFWEAGLDHLTADLVESIPLLEAMRRIRPYMPPAQDYDAKWSSLPVGTPTDSGYGILSKNAKLAKDESPDGIPGKCFGLVLAPHRVGLRVFGKPSPHGFAIEARKVNTQAGKDTLFSAKPDSGEGLATWSGVRFKSTKGSMKGARGSVIAPKAPTTCFRASGGDLGCMAACLVHSGQNPASDEALVSKLGLTAALYHDPAAFCRYLLACLRRFFAQGDCDKADYYVRLNVFSDIPWEWLFPDMLDPVMLLALRDFDTSSTQYAAPFRKGGQIHRAEAWRKRPVVGEGSFYDYTKIPHRMGEYGKHVAAAHHLDLHGATDLCRAYYHLTFSYSGVATNIKEAQSILEAGDNVAVVFVLEEGTWDKETFHSEGVGTVTVGKTHVEARFAKYGLTSTEEGVIRAAWTYANSTNWWAVKVPTSTKFPKGAGEPRTIGKFSSQAAADARVRKGYRHPLRVYFGLGALVKYADQHGISVPLKGAYKPARVSTALDVVQRITGDDTLDEDVFWMAVSPATPTKQLRGRHGKGRKGMTLPEGTDAALRHRYEEGWIYPFTFMGYPVINADRNDIRAKDPKAFPGPHIVGLDFKVPKIKTKVALWQVQRQVSGKWKDLSKKYKTPESAYAHAATLSPPGRVKQLGILTSGKLDIDKSAFVTAVRETPDGMLIASQTPTQTPGTRGGIA
tara:strand:- start:948 stop:3242 length:2295 start_codon:yes stop_codon:yes gene_type:complete